MISYEKEMLVRQRVRERQDEAARERLARLRTARHKSARSGRVTAALMAVRRLVRRARLAVAS
jgi:hypothetical protein